MSAYNYIHSLWVKIKKIRICLVEKTWNNCLCRNYYKLLPHFEIVLKGNSYLAIVYLHKKDFGE